MSIFVIIFLGISFCFGQKKQRIYPATFAQFDAAKNVDTLYWAIKTDKFTIIKEKQLDTIASKPYIDSVAWFMERNPYTVIEVYVKRPLNMSARESMTVSAALSHQLVNELVKRKIEPERLHTSYSRHEPLLIADAEILAAMKKKKAQEAVTKTTFFLRVLSEDYVDPNASK